MFTHYKCCYISVQEIRKDFPPWKLHRRELIHGGAQKICGCMATGCGKNNVSSFFLLYCAGYHCAFMTLFLYH